MTSNVVGRRSMTSSDVVGRLRIIFRRRWILVGLLWSIIGRLLGIVGFIWDNFMRLWGIFGRL